MGQSEEQPVTRQPSPKAPITTNTTPDARDPQPPYQMTMCSVTPTPPRQWTTHPAAPLLSHLPPGVHTIDPTSPTSPLSPGGPGSPCRTKEQEWGTGCGGTRSHSPRPRHPPAGQGARSSPQSLSLHHLLSAQRGLGVLGVPEPHLLPGRRMGWRTVRVRVGDRLRIKVRIEVKGWSLGWD